MVVKILVLNILTLTLVACNVVGDDSSTVTERMKRDWLVEQLLVEADAYAREVSKGGVAHHVYERRFRLYVPGYMAATCIEGSEANVEGFNTFIRNAVVDNQGPESVARQAIQAINSGIVDQDCLQPYLAPKSVSDALPATNLYIALAEPGIPASVG